MVEESRQAGLNPEGVPDALLLAQAIFDALKRNNPNACVTGRPDADDDYGTTIDGEFDFCAVAVDLLRIFKSWSSKAGK